MKTHTYGIRPAFFYRHAVCAYNEEKACFVSLCMEHTFLINRYIFEHLKFTEKEEVHCFYGCNIPMQNRLILDNRCLFVYAKHTPEHTTNIENAPVTIRGKRTEKFHLNVSTFQRKRKLSNCC